MTTDQLALILLAIVSAIDFTGIAFGTAMLARGNNRISHVIAVMLGCVAIEIAIATVSIFYLSNLILYAAMKIAGRLIELGGVAYFLFYLSRDR